MLSLKEKAHRFSTQEEEINAPRHQLDTLAGRPAAPHPPGRPAPPPPRRPGGGGAARAATPPNLPHPEPPAAPPPPPPLYRRGGGRGRGGRASRVYPESYLPR